MLRTSGKWTENTIYSKTSRWEKGVWVTSYRGPVVKLEWLEKRSPKMPKTGHKAKIQTKILDLGPNICDHRKNKLNFSFL